MDLLQYTRMIIILYQIAFKDVMMLVQLLIMALDLSFLREILQVVDLDYTELDKGEKNAKI